jgi:hypothetical protein
MNIKCPKLLPTLLIAEDAQFAAQLLCLFARPKSYLPIVEGPRFSSPNFAEQIVRCKNTAARIQPGSIILAGLSSEVREAVQSCFSAKLIKAIVPSLPIDEKQFAQARRDAPVLRWGRDHIGIGVLQALRSESQISFMDGESPRAEIPIDSEHIVVCEDCDDFAQVIAANYAYSLNAGLHIIPRIPGFVAKQLLEVLYSAQDQQYQSTSEVINSVKQRIIELSGPIPIPLNGSITFVTGGLPFGFAFTTVPSTHLFQFPNLGASIINGFAAEQPNTPGTGIAVLVDPEEEESPDISSAIQLLPNRGIFVRGYSGSGANVRDVSDMIERYPYDLLIISTHCADVSGHRCTYSWVDAEGIDRTLVVDIALGIGRPDQDEKLSVTEFCSIHSLDGVDWQDPEKGKKLYVGVALSEYADRAGLDGDLRPAETEEIARVRTSAALKMFDHNYIAVPRTLAGEGSPIIINNACTSWHRLAETFTYANARAYVGTLFPVLPVEANAIIDGVFGKHFEKPLALAVWHSQRKAYGVDGRNPYVVTGVYPQRIRANRLDTPKRIGDLLSQGLARGRRDLKTADRSDDRMISKIREYAEYYETELRNHIRRYGIAL